MAFDLASRWPMAAMIRDVFTEEIEEAGGEVSDAIDQEGWLFLRSVLPASLDVRRGDQVRAGVALRASEQELWAHPYVFRQVCSNGAIFAQAVQSRRVENLEDLPADDAEEAIRAAVQACCAPEAFETSVAGMRSSTHDQADEQLALRTVSLLLSLPRIAGRRGAQPDRELLRMVFEIIGRFREQEDRSRFALVNAVTAAARDVRAPALRWRLEELGGALAVLPTSHGPRRPESAEVEETILV
jgi:hypothetical protein